MNSMKRKKLVFVGASKAQKLLPEDLMGKVTGFMTNDWLHFKKVFHETPRTAKILEFIEFHSRNPPKGRRWGGGSVLHVIDNNSFQTVKIDADGHIIEICLQHMGLQDEDIRDLSNLPSKLLRIDLEHNKLTSINVANLPKGLQSLSLGDNNLIQIDLDGLSDSVQDVYLSHNKLKEVTWSKLPRSIHCIDLKHNQLIRIELHNLLPSALNWISLYGNRMLTIVVEEGMASRLRTHERIGRIAIPHDAAQILERGYP